METPKLKVSHLIGVTKYISPFKTRQVKTAHTGDKCMTHHHLKEAFVTYLVYGRLI